MKVFVSMPFRQSFNKVYDVIERAAEENRLKAYQVSQEPIAKNIPELIEKEIRESIIFLADITGNNPNVQNEIGQATALKKPMIFISQKPPKNAPFDIRDRKIICYSMTELDKLEENLKAALNSPNERLRSMLVPASLGDPEKHRFVIGISPLFYRRTLGRSKGYKKFMGTSSDYLGLRGLLQAFGLLYGFQMLPDIVDPEDCEDSVLDEPMTLYCIASPKANRWTGQLLKTLSEKWAPSIQFKADDTSEDLKNVKISLYKDNAVLCPLEYEVNTEGDRYFRDLGIIIRVPNPYCEDEMLTIIAGRSSLGTEAASRALTDPEIIEEISRRLSGFDISLDDHKKPFWVLVSMKRREDDEREEAMPDTLRVEQVDIFHKKTK